MSSACDANANLLVFTTTTTNTDEYGAWAHETN